MDQGEASTAGTSGRNADGPDATFKAKRYAVKFNPPCIFLEYEDTQTKRRVRAVSRAHVGLTLYVHAFLQLCAPSLGLALP